MGVCTDLQGRKRNITEQQINRNWVLVKPYCRDLNNLTRVGTFYGSWLVQVSRGNLVFVNR